MRNFHLPLPEITFSHLQAQAERAQVPVTVMAREAIDYWLKEQKKKQLHQEIAAYAAEMAGTEFDLDGAFEAASIEHLLETSEPIVTRKKGK